MKKPRSIVVDRVVLAGYGQAISPEQLDRAEEVEGFEVILPDAIERPPYDESVP
ncbi:hypothetical protein IQ235_06500 [Oscillatoriales cyanobacterium LEGE 11467]|uniref:Uncharacterized protein n=1 Tax=Zarconia navalis LEGE 11467 TaxID=1828826 RepID=A0A928VYG0_9CYAN|nr:hypothetical protein [Zarconia navalis]MBE9040438.1 hypothetical protein [Zarconia navalis LEGE 11467]